MLGRDFDLKYSEEICKKKRAKKPGKVGSKGRSIKFMQDWVRSSSVGRNVSLTDKQTDNSKSRDTGNGKLGSVGCEPKLGDKGLDGTGEIGN